MRELYKAKGYSDEWIEKRVRGIAIRDELTNEWQKRGVKEQREYANVPAIGDADDAVMVRFSREPGFDIGSAKCAIREQMARRRHDFVYTC